MEPRLLSAFLTPPFIPIGCYTLPAAPHWLPGRACARTRKCRGRSGGGDGEGRGERGGVELKSRPESWEWGFIPVNWWKLEIFCFKYPGYAWV